MFDERLVVNQQTKENIIFDEHLVRYGFAKQFVAGKAVLDVACGSGYGTKILAEAGATTVLGVDIDPLAVADAQKHFGQQNIKYIADSAESLEKIADDSIDVAVSFETIEHLKNPEHYLKALTRVVRYDGMTIISTPNRLVFGQKNEFHVHEYTKTELETILGKYFAKVSILEQNNAIASYLLKPGQNEPFLANNELYISNQPSNPLYFVAVCSKNPDFSLNISKNIVSLNPVALERWQNNPGWKLVNKLYGIIRIFLRK
jgi:2-polyprenyl-3-methyl-5-hydroxy-6-metoxy-1,4-benzoquinol methylase